MKFNRLRLSGFKSFVDPTELLIETGLTGIVGPNGCGKSNLLEALRWVMGETSFKSLRGAAMDDVIFSGSSDRPARNTAEVTVTLDNSNRTAPAQFNGEDTIEVSRRIEREAGSAYRINAREARARDVQMLFADAATGAHSITLVCQGQIGELLAAKPQARRVILEEAAGISGLHHRRHEAELRLRAAEQNLQRLDDVIGEIDAQLVALQRQARQAARYKNVAAKIRQSEALLLHLRWTEAADGVSISTAERSHAGEKVAELAAIAASTSTAENAAAEKLPPLRRDEAQAAAALQRLRNEDRTLAADAERTGERRMELNARLAQISADIERERSILENHAEQIETLAAEETELRKTLEKSAAQQADTNEKTSAARQTLEIAETELASKMSVFIELKGAHSNAASRLRECEARAERLKSDSEQVASQLDKAETSDATDASRHQAAIERALQTLSATEEQAAAAAQGLELAHERERTARDAADEAERILDRLEAESAALGPIAGPRDGQSGTMVERVTVVPGFETAIAAALGDDLDASIMPDAKMRWRELEPLAASQGLPEGAEPLAQFVNGPPSLARRLAFTGVVTPEEGELLQRRLTPGQRMVSREGDLWRWDGFVARAGAENVASKRLEARNRLEAIELEIDTAREYRDSAQHANQAAKDEASHSDNSDREARGAWRSAGQEADRARAALAEAERKAQAIRVHTLALQQKRERLNTDLADALTAAEQARAQQAQLASLSEIEATIEPLRAGIAEARENFSQAEAHVHSLGRDLTNANQRLERIAEEVRRWHGLTESAQAHITALGERSQAIQAEMDELSEIPEVIAAKRAKLADAVADAEKARSLAADRLTKAETTLGTLRADARRLDITLTEARETLARAEARQEAAEERMEQAVQAIRGELSCAPDQALAQVQLADSAQIPALAQIEEQLQRARAERERLGAVNLRAEDEASEQRTRSEELRTERDDLDKAIRRLRQGIGTLNSEARGRLTSAFDSVNEQFGNLFRTLFGGGTASLTMTASDDPLETGLEVIAHPPGKRPQTLTLLSGGEQALTAFALMLSVFRTNPSPICVLDEVDAPLDDHNVERFCNLVTKLAEEAATRFLVITHHPYTMARMDRLFGVTMAERGVSKLVSVDLDTAERFREAG